VAELELESAEVLTGRPIAELADRSNHQPEGRHLMIDRTVKTIGVNEHEAVAVMSVADLLDITIPARSFAANAKIDPIERRMVERLRGLRELIQRDFAGEKKKNAQGMLADYIREEWLDAKQPPAGFFGSFIAFFPDNIEIDEESVAHLSTKGFFLDGESRGEALLTNIERLEDDAKVDTLLRKSVVVHIVHGIDRVEVVAKYFADVNGKGVKVNPNLVAMADYTDPFAEAAKRIFADLGLELETRQRQVRVASAAILTGLQARLMVAAVAKGVGVVQYGAKPIPADGIDAVRLEEVAQAWLSRVFSTFNAEAFRDKGLVLRSVPVTATLGGLGRGFFEDDPESQRAALDVLTDERIDWSIGPHWDGIAGKMNPNTGRFTLGGGKEYAYATHRALTEPNSDSGRQIRHINTEAVPKGAPEAATV
jgi:hypothetical protein